MRPSVKKLLLFGSVAPYSGALLALDFVGSRTNGKPYYMLGGVNYPLVSGVPGWTYTGGTAAGTGSYAARQDGSLQFFPSYANLLTYSQELITNWTVTGGASSTLTRTANYSAAPDGTATATRLQFVTANYVINQQLKTTVSGQTYTWSIWLKSNGSNVTLQLGDDGIAALTPVTVTGSWQRFSVTLTANSTTSYFKLASYVNADVVAWGAQLELGSTASTYIPTTTAAVTVGTPRITDAGYWAEEARTNLLLRSQEFDNVGAWPLQAATVSANVTAAPDGTLTADKIVEAATTASHGVSQTVTKAASAITYTASAYFKADTRTRAVIWLNGSTSGNRVEASFNLSTGAVIIVQAIGTFTSASATITPASNGYFFATLTGTTNTDTSVQMRVFALDNTASASSPSYTGDGTSGIYIWQADLQAGSFATSPIPTTSVAVTRAADVGYVSGLVVPSAVTLRADFIRTAATASNFGGAASINGGSAANEIYITRNSSTRVEGYSTAASTPKQILNATVSSGIDAVSAAVRSAALDGGGAVGGALAAGSDVSTVVVPSSLTILSVGSRGGGATPNNGPIRRIVIYPRAFGNSELQAITTAGAY